jgi:hypothetical protein
MAASALPTLTDIAVMENDQGRVARNQFRKSFMNVVLLSKYLQVRVQFVIGHR